MKNTMRNIGVVVLGVIVFLIAYFISDLFVGALIVTYVCCGDFAPWYEIWIHGIIALSSGLFFIKTFWRT